MHRSKAAWVRLWLICPSLLLFGFIFLGVSPSPLTAQMPQEAGAPASDISNIPKPVISTVDSINLRNGPNDSRTGRKAVEKDGTCLLPPLTLISSPIIVAEQLQVPAKARKEYQQACAALKHQKTEDAEKHLRTAVHEYAKYSTAWVTLGQMLAAQNVRALRPVLTGSPG